MVDRDENRIVVLGAGESGVGSAVLAKAKEFDVFVSDLGVIKDDYKEILDKNNIQWEQGQHSEDQILNAREVVKSPGIPETAPLIKKLKEIGTSVVSEIEFASRYSTGFNICITGSNGKTTTTSLIYHILKNAGLDVAVGGNIGRSYAMQVAEEDKEFYVLELSSFQLDDMYEFKADIAILMNITPDHLDRYNYDMQEYVDSKFRILNNLTSNEHFIYCADDEVVIKEINKRKIEAALLPFTLENNDSNTAFIQENQISIKLKNTQFTMSMEDLALQGKHNAYNSMAAGIAANVLKIRKEVIRESLTDFQSVEHRLEPVIKVHGVQYINDSKATNVNSTWYALESTPYPVVWIAGGVDKGNDYEELKDLVKEKVKAIVCLGKDNSKIKEAFDTDVSTIVEAESMDEAVQAAYYLSKKGDTVLLSPACASFDLFENYEERGMLFKRAVRNL